ncbi:hypothetical protein ACQEVM_34015 [Streptomyces sp. CA-243310]
MEIDVPRVHLTMSRDGSMNFHRGAVSCLRVTTEVLRIPRREEG